MWWCEFIIHLTNHVCNLTILFLQKMTRNPWLGKEAPNLSKIMFDSHVSPLYILFYFSIYLLMLNLHVFFSFFIYFLIGCISIHKFHAKWHSFHQLHIIKNKNKLKFVWNCIVLCMCAWHESFLSQHSRYM